MVKQCTSCGTSVPGSIAVCPGCGGEEFGDVGKSRAAIVGRSVVMAILLVVLWWLYFRK